MPFLRWRLNATIFLLLASLIGALPKTHNLTIDEAHPMCTDSTGFTGRVYYPDDCLAALHKLESTDLFVYRARDFEFLTTDAEPTTDLDNIRLPRKYTVGTCTLVIAMLSTFPQFSLPGQVRLKKDYGTSERSKFSYLWSVAAWVDRSCLANKLPLLGWCATGARLDIGVFMVATGSNIDGWMGRSRVRGNSSSSLSPGLARLLDLTDPGESDVAES